MKTLYIRIYATVVAVLLLFALVSGWLLQRNIEREREQFQASAVQRVTAWAELLQNALPPPTAPAAEQAAELLDWSQRLRLPMALVDAEGRRIAVAPEFERWAGDAVLDAGSAAVRLPGERRAPQRVVLSDGRVLWFVRPPRPRGGPMSEGRPLTEPLPLFQGAGLAVGLGLLFIAVAAGAWPVVRRLTHRLEALKKGVEEFGSGALHHRVDESGRDEVAAVAASFNRAAARVESLLQANRSLLANASHELRSPLARLKMALVLLDGAAPGQRAALKSEIERDMRELDTLVEEVLLASRLDARGNGTGPDERPRDAVDVIALAAEEAARVDAVVDLPADGAAPLPPAVTGDERLLRRALRNLLENARRYGGTGPPELQLRRTGDRLELRVCDRGPGVPEAERERIFEPFYRLAGHAEQAGGVGLGLSLVRQIAHHHGGEVRCENREGGGSCFVLCLPAG